MHITTFTYIRVLLISLLCLVYSCASEQNISLSPIRIGKDVDLDTLFINKYTTQSIILSGGTGRYTASIADSRIAQLSVLQDTLRVKALLEGETFANIYSHDIHRTLHVSVIDPPLVFSHDTVTIRPSDKTKFVRLSGGGDVVSVSEDDPDDVIQIKWNGNTGVVEIDGYCEGDAYITATSAAGDVQRLYVRVKAEDEVSVYGIYITTATTISSYNLMNNVMVIKRPGLGMLMSDTGRPYGGCITLFFGPCYFQGSTVLFRPITDPIVKGGYVNMNVKWIANSEREILKNGTHRFYVEDVREEGIVIRKRGLKIFMPHP